MKLVKSITSTCIAAALATAAISPAMAAEKSYVITITNITKNILLTPFIASTHESSVDFFTVGEPASSEIAAIAEGGDIAPLMDVLLATEGVADIQATTDLLAAGSSVTFEINGNARARFLSLASMLLPTNDSFVGVDALQLPRHGTVTYFANAYDAGSEPNTELCVDIPGPTCGGEGLSEFVDGEGYIYPSPGIHGEADLSTAEFTWQGPVAKIVIEAVYQ